MHCGRREAGAGARPGARLLSSHRHRQCPTARRDFRARRSLVPHVRHRSCDAGGAARALSHSAVASCSLRLRPSRVCGRKDLMGRFRDDRPADVSFARGAFNSHPYVMTAMDEFLSRLASPNFRSVYNGLDETRNGRAAQLNDALAAQNLPVRVANLSSIWMVHYTEPSRYNWMFQYYLRAEGLALSWVGTGRLIFSLNYTEADFADVAKRFVTAAEKMKQDGWWWNGASLTNKQIRRQILKEMISSAFSR